MWFAAAKPKHIRLQNRRTMQAKIMLEKLLRECGCNDEVDPEYVRGLIWIGKSRVAADQRDTLLPFQAHIIVSLSTDSTQADHLFHFNVSVLSGILMKEPKQIEEALHRLQ